MRLQAQTRLYGVLQSKHASLLERLRKLDDDRQEESQRGREIEDAHCQLESETKRLHAGIETANMSATMRQKQIDRLLYLVQKGEDILGVMMTQETSRTVLNLLGGIEQVREISEEEVNAVVFATSGVLRVGAFWMGELLRSILSKSAEVGYEKL